MSETKEIHPSRVFGLDLMRALAIIFVIFAHAENEFLSEYFEKSWNFGFLGTYGVELFFVLSGFLIGQVLITSFARYGISFSTLRTFWKRRWWRTLPNYFLFLLIQLFISPHRAEFNWRYLFFLQNGASGQPRFFQESWSLAVEEWFYFTFPLIALLFYFAGKKYRRHLPQPTCQSTPITAFKALMFTALLYIVGINLLRFGLAHDMNLTWEEGIRKVMVLRIDSVMYGVVLALIKHHLTRLWLFLQKYALPVGLATLGLSLYFTLTLNLDTSIFARSFLFTLISVGGALLLPYLDNVRESRKAVATGSVLTHISLISYSMYLINIPATKFIDLFNRHSGLYEGIVWFTLTWIVVICAATLNYRFFEKPMMDRRDALRSCVSTPPSP